MKKRSAVPKKVSKQAKQFSSKDLADAAPWFDEGLKHSRDESSRETDLQRTLNEYRHESKDYGSSVQQHPQYGLWKITIGIITLLFVVLIFASWDNASITGLTADVPVADSASGAVMLAFLILLMFGFLVLVFYRHLNRR